MRAILVSLLFVSLSAFAELRVQTEEECVKSDDGHACYAKVMAHKSGGYNKRIHCGDTVVYGNQQAKRLINVYLKEGSNMVLTKNGQFKDGHCY